MFRTFEDSFCVFLTFSLQFGANPGQLQSTKGANRNPLQTVTARHGDHMQGLRQKCVLLWSDFLEGLETHEASVNIRLP